MDEIRDPAQRELGGRHGAERRYSDQLRQAAVAYWRRREPGVRAVATALGIAPMSLRRWAQDARFRQIHLVAEAGPVAARVVVYLHADIRLKERALVHATPSDLAPERYRAPDPLLAFLEGL